jgi:hypothetical protein
VLKLGKKIKAIAHGFLAACIKIRSHRTSENFFGKMEEMYG